MAHANDIDVNIEEDPDKKDLLLERNFRLIRDLLNTDDVHIIGAVGEIPFFNGWGNYGNGYQIAMYGKVGHQVFVVGSISNGVNDTPAFKLPIGYRPAYHIDFPTTVGIVTKQFGVVVVASNGDVVPDTTPIDVSKVSLPQIYFQEA